MELRKWPVNVLVFLPANGARQANQETLVYVKYTGGSLLDHVEIVNIGGDRVLLAQPYAVEGVRLAAFIQECDALELDVLVCGDTPYHTAAFGIRITRRG